MPYLLRRGRRAAVLITGAATAALAAAVIHPPAAKAKPGQPPPRASTQSGEARAINDLARTPYQGWNTYYGLGSNFNAKTIEDEADAIVDRGLKAAGYDYVWIDGGWWNGDRDASGRIAVDPHRWPHGMKAVADYIHSKGLKAGIYTDAGVDGCGGKAQGSYSHYQQDANTFAGWGYDAVKVDFCGGHNLRLDPATQYGQFRDALLNSSSHRPMLFNICNPFVPETGAAPLIIGSDVRALSQSTIDMLTNREVLAIDQDPLGRQGTALATDGDTQVWVRQLAGGDRAVALFNRSETATMVSTTAAAVGLPSAGRYDVRDVWHHDWLRATSGWLVPRVDQAVGGGPLRMNGTGHPTGLGVASPSDVEYYLGGRCDTLTGTVGIDDSTNFDPSGGTATFQVLGDGQRRYDSGLVSRPTTKAFSVDVRGADVLTLHVADGGDGGYNDRTDWADLELSCN